jgi:hypothetical protein
MVEHSNDFKNQIISFSAANYKQLTKVSDF